MPNKAQYLQYLQLPSVKAFLDTIAWAEGGKSYNTMYGGGTFKGNQHPNKAIKAGGYTSTAAGRYQFLYKTWIEIKNRLGLADFTAQNQDIAAVDLINQRGQLQKLIKGDLLGVLKGLGCAWAALPYSRCNQKERGINETTNYFNNALKVYSKGNALLNTTDVKNIVNSRIPANDTPKKSDNTMYYVLAGLAVLLLA